jgi:ubiquitin-like domain-containing CTD phosphatase 1
MLNCPHQVRGKMRVCRVKPLEFIWRRYPAYAPERTIMFDDVRHNFLCNPRNGLVIRPFRNGPSSRTDNELQRLARFLDHIAEHPDVRTIDLKRWERLLE